MGKLIIGRAGLDVPLVYNETWDHQSETVRVTGAIYGTVEEATTLRAQLLGCVASIDEPIVRVIVEDDESATGFYRVTDASVAMDGASLASGCFAYEVDLERVPDSSAPLQESVLVALPLAMVTDSADITADDLEMFHAAPRDVVGYYWSPFAGGFGSPLKARTRETESGPVQFTLADFDAGTTFAHFHAAPADVYVGSPALRVRGRLVAGRQIIAEPDDWSLDNGLVRGRPDPHHPGAIIVDVHDGDRWVSPVSWSFVIVSGGIEATNADVTGFQTNTVLRNGPEMVVTRVGCEHETASLIIGASTGRVNLDLSLRRGDRMLRCVLSSDKPSTWRIVPTPGLYTGEVLSASFGHGGPFDFGVIADDADADGNRPFVFGGADFHAQGVDTDALEFDGPAAAVGFALGAEIGFSSSPADGESAVDLALQWCGQQSERLTVVRR